MNAKELYAIREWAPLEVLDRIPAHSGLGTLFSANLNLTCVAATDEFLALGSDAGIVFWYNRQTSDIQKLRTETTSRITCVRIVNSVEFMVAAGHANGHVSVFQIQKALPPDLNLVAPFARSKPIERYSIWSLHNCAISCCEWSKNGMKLYTGDRQGVVVLTEFDYQTHLSKSAEILSEAYEIVQLSAYRSFLLVTTLYRSIVCQRSTNTQELHITQVGKKDRKQLIDCGGIFFQHQPAKSPPRLICGRPGLRFWIADAEGQVEKTLLFRDAVERNPSWEIPILNPKSTYTETNASDFRILHLYAGHDSLLVTHDENSLYILNLERLCVEGVARGFRKILDLCVCEKEIFVLEGERTLLRLAPMPEKPNRTAKIIFNPLRPPPVPTLGFTAFSSKASEDVAINAEECFELPSIGKLNLNIPIELAVESPRAEQNRRLEIFKQISATPSEETILHHSGHFNAALRKKRKSRDGGVTNKSAGIIEIGQTALPHTKNEDEAAKVQPNTTTNADNFKSTKPLREWTHRAISMEASYCDAVDASAELNIKAAYLAHLPDALTPESMKKTLECKAKTLAAELNLPELSHVSAKPMSQSQPKTEVSATLPAKMQISLEAAYPKQMQQLEDACVQTTPRKKFYDYLHGQPLEDICQTFHEDHGPDLKLNETTDYRAPALQFLPAQPINDDIESFLFDFRRAADPLSAKPPQSSDSNTSSDWEFLDN